MSYYALKTVQVGTDSNIKRFTDTLRIELGATHWPLECNIVKAENSCDAFNQLAKKRLMAL